MRLTNVFRNRGEWFDRSLVSPASLAAQTICQNPDKAHIIVTLNGVCSFLGCQPGDLLEYVADQPLDDSEA